MSIPFPLICLASAAFLLSANPESVPPLPPGHVAADIQRGPDTMRCVIARSASLAPDEIAPVILFLHGSGECGTDGRSHLGVGLPPQFRAHSDRWPFVLVMPQKPVVNAEWEDYENEVLRLVDEAIEAHGGDPQRVLIAGLSQGGHGALAIASRNPERFVGVLAVCPYIEPWIENGAWRRSDAAADSEQIASMADALRGVPVRLFHGDADSIVPVNESRVFDAELRRRGCDVVYTEYPGVDHDSWTRAFGESGVWEWAQRLGKPTTGAEPE